MFDMFTESQNFSIVQTELDAIFYKNNTFVYGKRSAKWEPPVYTSFFWFDCLNYSLLFCLFYIGYEILKIIHLI